MSSLYSQEYLISIGSSFCPSKQILSVRELPFGNINKTFLVVLKPSSDIESFVIQEINTSVFSDPEIPMYNWNVISLHISKKIREKKDQTNYKRWDIPTIIPTIDKGKLLLRIDDKYWRAITFIQSSTSLDKISNAKQAKEVGKGLATFHYLIKDFPLKRIKKLDNDLHDITKILSDYDKALNHFRSKRISTPSIFKRFSLLERVVDKHRSGVSILNDAIARGELMKKPIHGDPKITNFMFDNDTKDIISLIDLDTLASGIIHYDIGDCIRSCCNLLGEETKDLANISFDLEFCEALLTGYLSIARKGFSAYDFYYLPYCIKFLPYELAIRFLTDFMNGNIYFKVQYSDQNLYRAEVQLRLVESIHKQWDGLLELTNMKIA
ncbi:phosphotransferase enzyme family protein [Prochlorococcus sp. MIT 1307]|uniref:phosphotransferase enzyme family protein n=1 Tax=Prochlorococcus sp. MIT 1307 TaxID=3096219 RepID=UPI002A75608F|nr:phosphotransferase [Prochlorococcus sp. MIT 1307]